VNILPSPQICKNRLQAYSQRLKIHRGAYGTTPKARKRSGEALGKLPKAENGPAEVWAYSKKNKNRKAGPGQFSKAQQTHTPESYIISIMLYNIIIF